METSIDELLKAHLHQHVSYSVGSGWHLPGGPLHKKAPQLREDSLSGAHIAAGAIVASRAITAA
eukprot:scaffold430678_cov37-Prasinocladus_malaysianus.AAC.1